jgi:hypothetical protein
MVEPMTATVIDFRAAKARRIALRKAGTVRKLAEELAALSNTPEGRLYMAGLYEGKGWANPDELQMALVEIGVEL